MDKGKTKAQICQIVYNLSESKMAKFASMGIFLLIIANLILLWLFSLSTIVANCLIALRQKVIIDFLECRIEAERLDIEFNQAPLISKKPQRVKLYNMVTLPQWIQLWLIVGLLLCSLITNVKSIVSSFHLLHESNSIFQGTPRI